MISRVDDPAFDERNVSAAGNHAPAASIGESSASLSDDLLRGADEIARFVFGDANMRRRVYYYARDRRIGMPVFRMGGVFCARKSSLLEWIDRQEGR